MICPNCGFQQDEARECVRCGVVVARFQGHTRPPRGPQQQQRPLAAAEEEKGPGLWARVRSVLLWAAVAALAAWHYGRPAPEARTPEPLPSPGQTVQAPPSTTAPTAPSTPWPPAVSEPTSVATPTPTTEAFPAGQCPLADRGYGAPPSRNRIHSGWYTRASDYETAVKEQAVAAAPLVLYVYTDWCQYCRAFERELLSSSTVDGYLSDKAVKLRINPDAGPDEKAFARRIGATGYPTFLVSVPGDALRKMSIYDDATTLREPEDFVRGIEQRVAEYGRTMRVEGLRARRGGRPDEAIAALTLALRADSEDAQAYLERGLAHAAKQADDEALDDFARAARLRQRDPAPVVAADDVLSRQQRWNDAIACWTGYLERSPSDARALLARSRALEKAGMPGLARGDAERACQLGERSACVAGGGAG